jgi:hypothetical protein
MIKAALSFCKDLSALIVNQNKEMSTFFIYIGFISPAKLFLSAKKAKESFY